MCVRDPPLIPKRVAYYSFSEVVSDAGKHDGWVVLRRTTSTLTLGRVDEDTDIDLKIMVSDDFSCTITRKGLLVPLQFDVEVVGLKSVMKELAQRTWCSGSAPRSKHCSVILDSSITSDLCQPCSEALQVQKQQLTRPINPKTPLSSASTPALVQEVKLVRAKLKEKAEELAYIQKKLQHETIPLSAEVGEGLQQVMESTPINNDFIQIFWDEQKKAASRSAKGMRWHPMMIRFAIYLHYQSARAYEALLDSGVLKLPNKSTLRDYTNFFQPKEGFQSHVFLEIGEYARKLPESQRYAALLHDEMAIRGDLVYDHRCGEIIGFINPQTWNFRRDVENDLASHVIVFMAVGINSNLKTSLGYFGTRCATADILFPLMWEAIGLLELQGVKVISSTSDKASPNQRLYRMHGDDRIVHQTVNPFALDDRLLFFISDPPHLIKTIRNNLESSRPGGTRCLWKNGQHLWWQYIYEVYATDATQQLRMTKLRDEHVRLTPSSRMSVRLAAQVLSNTVGVVLRDYHGQDRSELSQFLLQCDRFFDCLNTRSFTEHIQKRKPDLAPYRLVNDPRFQYLENFVAYLNEWRDQVEARDGFSRAEKEKMFLSYQTFEGIVTAVRGFIGATRFLLSHGVTYVLSNTFCQDPIEEHFGRHRGLGNRSRNPSLYEFGYQENQLRIQRGLAFRFNPRGNTAGRPRDQGRIEVDNQPLPKIRRH